MFRQFYEINICILISRKTENIKQKLQSELCEIPVAVKWLSNGSKNTKGISRPTNNVLLFPMLA